MTNFQKAIKDSISEEALQKCIEEWIIMGDEDWDGMYPYCGICDQFYIHFSIQHGVTSSLLKQSYGLDTAYYEPLKRKEGAHFRAAVLTQLKEDIYGK